MGNSHSYGDGSIALHNPNALSKYHQDIENVEDEKDVNSNSPQTYYPFEKHNQQQQQSRQQQYRNHNYYQRVAVRIDDLRRRSVPSLTFKVNDKSINVKEKSFTFGRKQQIEQHQQQQLTSVSKSDKYDKTQQEHQQEQQNCSGNEGGDIEVLLKNRKKNFMSSSSFFIYIFIFKRSILYCQKKNEKVIFFCICKHIFSFIFCLRKISLHFLITCRVFYFVLFIKIFFFRKNEKRSLFESCSLF